MNMGSASKISRLTAVSTPASPYTITERFQHSAIGAEQSSGRFGKRTIKK
jgi:hypothetical protein